MANLVSHHRLNFIGVEKLHQTGRDSNDACPHTRGKGVCGVFTFEIAETKVAQVNEFARQNEHPLKCTMEKA